MLRHNYLSSIRLALTLFDFPVYTSGFRSAISCLDGQPLRATPSTSRPFSKTCVPTMKASVSPHMKSRCPEYPGSQIKRFPVSDAQVDWSHSVQGYEPVHFTHPAVAKKPAWADPEIGSFCPQFNTVDGAVDRRSFEGRYKVEDGKPLWKVDAQGEKIHHLVSKKPILQFVSIKRKDCGEWAIPGGMVDPGEQISLTLQREFSEEALNSLAVPPSERENIRQRINRLFQSGGFQVFEGYVDDPRNTDNAWMETVAINFHDENGNCVSELPLQAGDDAGQVQWVDVDSSFLLYASHSHLLQMVVTERNAHW
ncbi:ADP-ribose pyrophosphatase, mitochondrial isoform X2 [Entelurus aequoreus]|uniref:ADP-ribose pyrophosphatase, mitochondrial isoform X2 n=1 Tax=Entelurus aequoreus TaxID=161455 RepID=UPI002B1DE199|nr:ADP-ribose pyrophosphatase, mitochondrial isoform X2 [Entelurus aequoreus]